MNKNTKTSYKERHLKNVEGIWRAVLKWSARRMRPAGRILATPAIAFQRQKTLSMTWKSL